MHPFDVTSLDDAALDALPVGVVELDQDGRVARYNQAEARRARTARWQVMGRDFFRDVAWSLGPDAVQRIQAFHTAGVAGAPGEHFHARACSRAGVHDLDVTLARGRDGHTIVIVASA